jgi:hypothetical protein
MPFYVGGQPPYIQDEACFLREELLRLYNKKGEQFQSHPGERRNWKLRPRQKEQMIEMWAYYIQAQGSHYPEHMNK